MGHTRKVKESKWKEEGDMLFCDTHLYLLPYSRWDFLHKKHEWVEAVLLLFSDEGDDWNIHTRRRPSPAHFACFGNASTPKRDPRGDEGDGGRGEEGKAIFRGKLSVASKKSVYHPITRQ